MVNNPNQNPDDSFDIFVDSNNNPTGTNNNNTDSTSAKSKSSWFFIIAIITVGMLGVLLVVFLMWYDYQQSPYDSAGTEKVSELIEMPTLKGASPVRIVVETEDGVSPKLVPADGNNYIHTEGKNKYLLFEAPPMRNGYTLYRHDEASPKKGEAYAMGRWLAMNAKEGEADHIPTADNKIRIPLPSVGDTGSEPVIVSVTNKHRWNKEVATWKGNKENLEKLKPFFAKDTHFYKAMSKELGFPDLQIENIEEQFYKNNYLPVVEDVPETEVIVRYSLAKWTTPMFGFEYSPDDGSNISNKATIVTKAISSGKILVYHLVDEAEMKTISKNFSSKTKKFLQQEAEKEGVGTWTKMWQNGSTSGNRDAFFKLYPNLLGLRYYSKEELRKADNPLREFFATNIPKGFHAEDHEDILRKKSDYHYSYAYCYFLLDCLLINQLARRSELFIKNDDPAMYEKLQNELDQIHITMTTGVEKLNQAIETNLEKRDDSELLYIRDRSVAILVFYTLWKIHESQVNVATKDLALSQVMGNKHMDDIKSSMRQLHSYLVKQNSPLKMTGGPSDTPSLKYKDAYKTHKPGLLGGFLMTHYWDDKNFTAQNWSELLDDNLFEMWGSGSGGRYWHWYNLLYTSRLFEIAAKETEFGRLKLNETYKEKLLNLQQQLLQLYSESNYQKLQSNTKSTTSFFTPNNPYDPYFFRIGRETLSQAMLSSKQLRLHSTTDE